MGHVCTQWRCQPSCMHRHCLGLSMIVHLNRCIARQARQRKQSWDTPSSRMRAALLSLLCMHTPYTVPCRAAAHTAAMRIALTHEQPVLLANEAMQSPQFLDSAMAAGTQVAMAAVPYTPGSWLCTPTDGDAHHLCALPTKRMRACLHAQGGNLSPMKKLGLGLPDAADADKAIEVS